jgi:hypothetical protein
MPRHTIQLSLMAAGANAADSRTTTDAIWLPSSGAHATNARWRHVVLRLTREEVPDGVRPACQSA